MAYDKEFNNWLSGLDSRNTHRQILSIELDNSQSKPYLLELINRSQTCVLITEHSSNFDLEIEISDNKHVRLLLGSSKDLVIYDASFGINLNALYAIAGTIAKKGLLVILGLHLVEKAYQQQKQIFSFSYNDCSFEPRFHRFLRSQIDDTGFAKIDDEGFRRNKLDLKLKKDDLHHALAATDFKQPSLDPEQQEIFDQIRADLKSLDTEPNTQVFLILAARGRGKSFLLAHIAQYLKNNSHSFSLTASHKNHLVEITKQLDSTIDEHFVSSDHLVNDNKTSKILIVDEIASIAPELIKQYLNKYQVVIFSGTTDGYEGSGQGFMLRTLPFIQAQFKTTRFTLTHSKRWFKNDPIEKMFNRLFGDSRISTEIPFTLKSTTHTVQFKANDLLNDFHLYTQVINLLKQAHYQNTVNDVLRILESGDQSIFATFIRQGQRTKVIAVAITISEGGDTLRELSHAISLGKRRVQGHLTPQSLSYTVCNENLCLFKYLRVSRIAVDIDYRGKKIGSHLLSFIDNYAVDKGYDFLSVSFGINKELIKFWLINDYFVVKIGDRVDTSSSLISGLFLKICNPKLELDHLNHLLVKIKTESCSFSQAWLKTITTYNDENFDTTQSELLNHYLSLYLRQEISLKHIHKFLVCHAKQYNQTVLKSLLKQYKTKGLHRHQRLEIENKIRQEIKNPIKN